MNEKRQSSTQKNTIPFLFLTLILIIILIIVIVFAFKQSEVGKNNADTQSSDISSKVEKWQEGVIKYDGKYYKYNKQIDTYLIMGIDENESQAPVTEMAKGGQSDAMFLLVVNKEKESMQVISINRNSMTDIRMYNESGEVEATVKAQLCTQHGFGDGKKLSCSRTLDAVSNLFYNIPINGYLSIRMGAIPIINDAIGGVKLTVLQDISYPNAGVELKEGELKILKSQEAYWYLRGRDINTFDSASDRLRRQEQYIDEFVDQMKAYTGGSTSKMLSIYSSVEGYIVTNIDFADLATKISDYSESEEMLTVPGETIMGAEFEEYHVDDDALYDMIIDVFYQEVS